MPEAGKATFRESFTTRVAQVKARYPDALQVCLGDGAQWNWDFFHTHYPEAVWVLDFYHAATHLQGAAEVIFSAPADATAYYDRWRTTVLEEANGVAALLRAPCSTTATRLPCLPAPSVPWTPRSTTSASTRSGGSTPTFARPGCRLAAA